MAYQRPGVYVEEKLNAIAPIVGPSSTSVAAFVGGNNRGPLEPTLVTSWSQFTNLYGTWNGSNKLPMALYLFFSNGGSQAYVQRVVSANAVAATKTFKDVNEFDTLKLTASNPGLWGNKLYATIVNNATAHTFDLIIAKDEVTSVVKRFTDLSMDPTSPRYAVSVINADKLYVVAEDRSSTSIVAERNPINATQVALATGADGTDVTDANLADSLSAFDTIKNSLILNVPGLTSATEISSVLQYAEARTDVFVVIDPTDLPVGTTATLNTQLNVAASYPQTSYGAVYYPKIVVADPTSNVAGATKSVNPGGAVVGKYVATDAARGVFKAPAGTGVRITGAVSVPVLTNAELDLLNSSASPVNAIRYVTGSGIVIMGARTLKAGYADMYVPVRRTLIYLSKAMTDLTTFAIFEPNDTKLWRQVTAMLEGFLTNFWENGGLRGATPGQSFFVKCDGETNPLSAIEAGEVNIEVGVALQRPAEFVIIKIGQYDGGTTVTVA